MQEINGAVLQVLVSEPHLAPLSSPQDEIRVTWEGFAGDRHAGLTMRSKGRMPHYPRGAEIRNTRQISIVSTEDLAAVAEDLGVPQVLPEWLGANLMLSGIPSLSLLPPGTRLFFSGEASLVVEAENLPCTIAGEAIQQQFPAQPGLTSAFPKIALHKRGLVAWVERPGTIRVGDELRVQVPEQKPYPD